MNIINVYVKDNEQIVVYIISVSGREAYSINSTEQQQL